MSMCGGYMEEAVFGLRLENTGVPLQEKRPNRGNFPSIRDIHSLAILLGKTLQILDNINRE